jgi:hypothetical protein
MHDLEQPGERRPARMRAETAHQCERQVSQTSGDAVDDEETSPVRPVEIIENQAQRPLEREALEEVCHLLRDPEPHRLRLGGASHLSRQKPNDLSPIGLGRIGPEIERVRDSGEGNVLLERVGLAARDREATFARERLRRTEKPRLSDPGLAFD